MSASTKLILVTNKLMSTNKKKANKSDIGSWRSSHTHFKSYLSQYENYFGHWRSDQSCLIQYKSDIGYWRSDHSHFKICIGLYK